MRYRMARPNIKEVASAAGTSTQAISRVINKKPDVSQETRKRVQTLIEAPGYKPGVPASGWIRRQSYISGTVTAAEQAGFFLLLKELPSSNKYKIFQAVLSRHVDGSIWAVPEFGENHLGIPDAAPDINLPLVYVPMAPQKNISVVTTDHYQGDGWRLSMFSRLTKKDGKEIIR
jgi:DNA-binding LacI/PurR family transcriptional regulator